MKSFLPTLLVTLLALLVPVLLFLIGKKAHTILTLSQLGDTIMTRFYKFLVCKSVSSRRVCSFRLDEADEVDSVLVFFCVGTATLIAILRSLAQNRFIPPLDLIAQSFPAAAPFYVGWCAFLRLYYYQGRIYTDTIAIVVFQSGMGGLELGLYGLPLLVYPSTRASSTLRKRKVGTRPRTVSFYCASSLPASVGSGPYLVR